MSALRKIKIQPKTRFAIVFSVLIVLSVSHHLMNFWGLPFLKMTLVLLGIPALAVALDFLLTNIWDVSARIGWKRWSIFLLPAFLVSSYLAWRIFELPVTWHQLEIIPVQGFTQDPIQLVEIKESNGSNVKFNRIQNSDGWRLSDEMLVSSLSGHLPLRYSFDGPVYKPVSLTFWTSAHGGDVQILLDGALVTVNLADPNPGFRSVQLDARYRFGIPGIVMVWVTTILDLFMFLFFFSFLWLIQESQTVSQRIVGVHGISHRMALSLLVGIGLVLHLLNFFSAPLLLDADSPSYMQGAAHWVKYHNFDGVSPSRGPGTTILFIPVLSIFGRNPWGMKALLHLLALACAPLTYWLAWQLNPKKQFAILAGLLAVFTPDLYFYSNFVMSEIPNVFFILLFCASLLLAVKTLSFKWMTIALLTGSFLTLLRPENLIALAIGIAFLLFRVAQESFSSTKDLSLKKNTVFFHLIHVGVASLLAALPVLGWAAHNQRLHGFFGLSNYAGEVFYTGWIYHAEASRIPFTDPNSPAVQIIKDAYWHQPGVAQLVVPTGWEIYPYLIKQGYTDEEAFAILRQAALDSIMKDYRVTLDVLAVKLEDSFVPAVTATLVMALPGEPAIPSAVKSVYFDEEQAPFPALLLLQQKVYALLEYHYLYIYPAWFWFCLVATFYSLYRRPSILWTLIVLIALTRVFLPNLIGLSHWRPVVSGIILLQIFGLAGAQTLWIFLSRARHKLK